MDARAHLYQYFDRKVGNPKQWKVHNMAEMNNFILSNSGQNDECYASVCSFQNNQPVFDDLFLEEDNRNISALNRIAQYYTDNDIPYIPLYSGNRGYQIHALFTPEIVTRETVKAFAKEVLKETKNESLMDEHVTGNLTNAARIPNTQRINGNWCIPLTYEYALTENIFSQTLELSKSPQFINYNITHRPSISEFVKATSPDNAVRTEYVPLENLDKFILSDFIRPCIYAKLCSPNPRNEVRVAATRDALLLGLNQLQLLDAYSKLKWVDFNPSDTKYYINKVFEGIKNGKHHYGKERLGCTIKSSCFKCLLGAK